MAKTAPIILPLSDHDYRICFDLHATGTHLVVIHIASPDAHRPLADARIDCNFQLLRLLGGKAVLINRLAASSSSVEVFANKLFQVASTAEASIGGYASTSGRDLDATQSIAVLEELEQLGWQHLSFVSTDLTEITLKLTDQLGIDHVVGIKLPATYPTTSPQITTSFPVPFALKWDASNRLRDCMAQLLEKISQLEPFWREVKGLYERTQVLDPAQLDPSVCSFRIHLQKNTSMQLDMNPNRPRAKPVIQFLGPASSVSSFQDRLDRDFRNWSPAEPVVDNLETLLSMSLSRQSAEDKAGEAGDQTTDSPQQECGVCYTYRLEQELPDKICSNELCAKPFHATCLAEWLQALPQSRKSFSTIFGECPYCGSTLSVELSAVAGSEGAAGGTTDPTGQH